MDALSRADLHLDVRERGDLGRPRTPGIEDAAGANFFRRAVAQIAQLGSCHRGPVAQQAQDLRVVADRRSVSRCAAGVERAEPKRIDPVLVHRDGAERSRDHPGFQLVQLVVGEPRVRLAVLERLVAIVRLEVAVRAVQQRAVLERRFPRPVWLHRVEEGNAKQQVRRDALDVSAVQTGETRHLRVGHQVADAAVDHPAVRAGRAGGEVLLLDQHGGEPAHRGVPGDAGAVHAPADHEEVVAPHPPDLRRHSRQAQEFLSRRGKGKPQGGPAGSRRPGPMGSAG